MKAREVAEKLMKTPDAEVLVRVSNDWVEVCDVGATGEHRNAVALLVMNPALGGGVIVVEPDLEK